jgi:hypothetical protein
VPELVHAPWREATYLAIVRRIGAALTHAPLWVWATMVMV